MKRPFTEVGEGLHAVTTEGNPNSGVIIGEGSVPTVTDKPNSHVVLSHYHAARSIRGSACGAEQIIAYGKAQASSSRGARFATEYFTGWTGRCELILAPL